MHLIELPSGLRFGLSKERPPAPAPTLFIFASSLEASLTEDDFCGVGRLVEPQGYLYVALDVPCHGCDKREGEPVGLDGWRARLENGNNPFSRFSAQCSEVLDFLLAEGYSDPDNIAVSGTSRGGFCGFHFAAADPRVGAAIAFGPVTRLTSLREFDGWQDNGSIDSLVHLAPKLADRPLWLIIGNRDERVNTDYAIEFARSVVAASATTSNQNTLADVTLHVLPSLGHRTPEHAHEMAALWLLSRRR